MTGEPCIWRMKMLLEAYGFMGPWKISSFSEIYITCVHLKLPWYQPWPLQQLRPETISLDEKKIEKQIVN